MSQETFKRTKLSSLLGLAAAGLLLTAASVHSQTTTAGSKADNPAAQSTASGSSAQGAGASGTSGASGATAGADASTASKSSDTADKISKSDREMMEKIAEANIAEIETGKLAQEKSKNEQVRSFAKKMVDDHTQAQSDLEKIAQAKNVTLPSKPDAKHQAAMKKLNTLSEADFDKQYMAQAGLNDHRDTHRLLERVSKQAKDDDLKQYATKTIAAVDEHLKMAREMSGSSAGSSAGSGATGSSPEKSGAKPEKESSSANK